LNAPARVLVCKKRKERSEKSEKERERRRKAAMYSNVLRVA